MDNKNTPYSDVKSFLNAIEVNYFNLPKRLQSIARELHFHKESVAFMSVNELAALLEVSPSALVRFAKTLGFSGFAEMKALFQQNVADQISVDKYSGRIKALQKQEILQSEQYPYCNFISDIVQNNLVNLQVLKHSKLQQALHEAMEILIKSKTIWIIAAGRSFAAAAYFTYLLRYTKKQIHWINGLCFNHENQLKSINKEDVVFIISYAPYAKESVVAAKVANKKGAEIITITDSHLNDISKLSNVTLEIHEHSSFGFRALTNTMCLLQILFLMYAKHTEMNNVETK